MAAWDLVVVAASTPEAGGYTLTVEKRPLEGEHRPTLEVWLQKEDVADAEIGRAIEALEALPYGAASVQAHGRTGIITIEQVRR